MNRNLRESLAGGRNTPAISQFRRGNNNNISQNGFSRDSDENLDLFSKIRRSFPLSSSSDELLPDVSTKLGRLSVGSKPAPRGKADDLLSSAEGGKNDYDWLLTPPGTPLGNDSHSSLAAPKITPSSRASSASKASRLSVSQTETSYHSTRPARSSSLTRPSISTSQYTSNRSPSSILNTSSASVSSYIRPSSPSSRSSSSARPSTPTRTSSASRASTPSRIRPVSSSSSSMAMDKPRPSLSSRPSTPTSRPQLTANSPNIVTSSSRPNSRPSTPTRRTPSIISSASATPGSNISNGRNGRVTPSSSRPSSPGPRVRTTTTTPQQPIVLADFPLDTPPNLRTSLPGRPISTGRSRPAATSKASPEPKGPLTRRNSSPVVTRGRLAAETQGKGRFGTDAPEPPRRISNVADVVTSRRTVKTSSSTVVTDGNNNGLGRSFSKNSLDMAIRHMDIRNGKSNGCALSTTTLFPQSIRQASSKIQPIRSVHNHSDSISSSSAENGNEANEGRRLMGKLSDMDMYESSRYDALLLKEDVKNTNWLHSIDDRSSDHGLMFDNGGFELLPEPFGPL